ncbi:MAG TPA: potassium-transporting ATPase subunit KdpA [Ignavibacteria bacterium]|nr:potassium-transporting ATPase subunit KdpA [Ignavibacteria bacterium]
MDILFIIIFLLLLIGLAIPFGRYISKVYKGEKTFLDFLLNPLDNLLYKVSGIDSKKEMDWRDNLKAFLTINLIWFIWGMIVLLTQTWQPFWNPDGMQNIEPYLAFNTVISFVTNTNLQHYSGEVSLSYFTQTMLIGFLQFVSAGIGMAVLAVMFRAFASKSTNLTGNVYFYFVRSCTRILLPIAFIGAIFVMLNGTPATFEGAKQIITLQGDTVSVAKGPVASVVSIKQLGTNGGGYFGINSSHPFENPNALTNWLENFFILIIPMAMVFAFGFYCNMKKFAYVIFAVMLIGYLAFLIPTVSYESAGNQLVSNMGVVQPQGNMEGKEVRFGGTLGALWGISTTCTSNGSVNAMHDSFMPLSGMFLMLGMMVNAFFGGVGVGFINMFIFIVITVFIGGLMIGRTPELFGKKIEAREVKLAIMIAVLHPLLILTGTAIASYVAAHNADIDWLNNPSYHGFSEMLYEFTSASANNGSGFEGLGDNTPFWNISTGVVMLLARFIPIIFPLAIAGFMAQKRYIPASTGTLRVDTAVFGITLFAVIIIIAALTFAPALISGPVAEFLTFF